MLPAIFCLDPQSPERFLELRFKEDSLLFCSNLKQSLLGRGPGRGDTRPAHPPGTNTAAKTTASVFLGGRGEEGS